MKISIITFFLIFLYFKGYSQTASYLPIDKETKLITYSEVVIMDSTINKNELYSRAREWFAKAFKSSINVIQMDDKENGKIIGKGLTQVYHKSFGKSYPSGNINFTISLYLKDGKYKYEITNFHHTGETNVDSQGNCEDMIHTQKKLMGLSYQKTFDYYLLQLDTDIKQFILSLKTSMNAKAKTSAKDNF